MINKSATKIGTIEFKNGNRNTIYIGANRNTGASIVWQQVAGRRATRHTGKNINKLATELNVALNEGEVCWFGDRNDAALDHLKTFCD